MRLSESSKACGALASQGELCQQTVKELELELLQQSQAAKQQSRLREQLSQEGQRAAQAEKRVSFPRPVRGCSWTLPLGRGPLASPLFPGEGGDGRADCSPGASYP